MGTRDERETKEKPTEPFKLVSEIESLSPEDEFLVWAQHCKLEGQKIACESRVQDEILSAVCDCHGDSCCC